MDDSHNDPGQDQRQPVEPVSRSPSSADQKTRHGGGDFLEVPSGNAIGTARAIARAYHVFASGRRELGLRKETQDLLAAPAIPPTRGFHDECLKADVQFSLGFMKPSAVWPFGTPSSFGAPGSGGALGFADPSTGVGYGYVTSQMGTTLNGDPRDVALRDALYSALLRRSSGAPPVAA